MAESENIVAETAEKIFSDLADAQTVNRDRNGGWKAPLWQALTENGLPLSWVPEDCGGSGASLAEGFWRAERGRTLCDRGAAGRNHAGGLAVVAGKNRFARGRDDGGAPLAPRTVSSSIPTAPCQGGRAAFPFAKAAKHLAVLASGPGGCSIRAGGRISLPDRGRPQPRQRRQRHRDLRQCFPDRHKAGAGRL